PVQRVLIAIFLLLPLAVQAQLHSFGWVNLQGGKTVAATYAVTSDQHGSSYYTGTLSGIVNFGGVTLSPHVASDVYVGILNNEGVLVWAAQLGAQSAAQPSVIALDNAGNVYVTGTMID